MQFFWELPMYALALLLVDWELTTGVQRSHSHSLVPCNSRSRTLPSALRESVHPAFHLKVVSSRQFCPGRFVSVDNEEILKVFCTSPILSNTDLRFANVFGTIKPKNQTNVATAFETENVHYFGHVFVFESVKGPGLPITYHLETIGSRNKKRKKVDCKRYHRWANNSHKLRRFIRLRSISMCRLQSLITFFDSFSLASGSLFFFLFPDTILGKYYNIL